jgi:hypothetical protein
MGVLAAPAYATFHLEKVNELMLASGGGDHSVQFVELLDKGGTEEAFTPIFAPYKLVVYDGAANKLGEHMLDPTGLRNAAAAAGGQEYLISTAAADAALGVTGDERLDVSLPVAAGQACFEANPTPPAFNCMTWGTITKPVPTNSQGTGSVHGPVPPNGQSDQLQPDGSVQAAPPTPKKPNRAGTKSSSGGSPGTTMGSSNPSPNPSTTPPFPGTSVGSRTARVDRRGRALVMVRCPAGAVRSCSGILTLKGLHRHGRLGRAAFTVSPGSNATVKVRLSLAARRRLARSGRLAARAVAVVHDDAGRTKVVSAQITLVK